MTETKPQLERVINAARERDELLQDLGRSRAALTELINEARDSGFTLQEIADVLGVSRARVLQVSRGQ